MGGLALVGDHSTVSLTRVSCNTVFSKSQNARKGGDPLYSISSITNKQVNKLEKTKMKHIIVGMQKEKIQKIDGAGAKEQMFSLT